MNVSRLSTLQLRKLSAIRETIAVGDYHKAAEELGELPVASGLPAEQAKTLDFLHLQVFNRLQWLVEAVPVVDRLLACNTLASQELLELALFYVLTGKTENASRYLKQAIAQDKRSQLLASELAILYEQQGKSDKALVIYNRIYQSMLERKKVDAVGIRVLSRLTGLRPLEKPEIKRTKELLAKCEADELESSLLFSLARAYAKNDDTENEIDCLKRANRAVDQRNEATLPGQTIEASRAKVEGVREIFDKPEPDWLQEYATSDKRPIFILGMPRSGTTLLEQILGAHSSVGNTGESRAMGIAFQRRLLDKSLLAEDEGKGLPFLRYKTLNIEDSRAIINYYDAYQSLLSEQPVVTDKELSNVDRVGMILQFYPQARFIAIRRHPLDVCASILQQDFSQAWFSASALKIVQEYEAYYARVNHWVKLWPERIVSIEYESLVTAFEQNVRQLLAFLGLPWEDAVEKFYMRNNSVRTPSLSQVRSAINTGSVEKWRKYHELLKPAEDYISRISVSENGASNNSLV